MLPIVIIVLVAIARICDQPLLIRAFRARENGVRFAQNENFQYDVFVSYAEEDDGWVRDHLMPELEGRLGLRLCVHQRDFHPGRNILDNIEDCVESSKKAMMIFSTHFARSRWCQFELSPCQRHVMDNDDLLMTVCVEDVRPREWTSGMMAILRTSTYIQWSEDPQHRANFWNIVVNALNDVIPAARPAAQLHDLRRLSQHPTNESRPRVGRLKTGRLKRGRVDWASFGHAPYSWSAEHRLCPVTGD